MSKCDRFSGPTGSLARVRMRPGFLSFCVGALSVTPAGAADAPVDRFLSQLSRRPNVSADAKALIQRRWADCEDCDGNEFLTQALAVVSPEFRKGLDDYDADNYEDCAARMRELATDDDPFIAIHASVYEIKSLVALDRTLEAGERLKALAPSSADVESHSYFAAEVDFLRGYCLLADLQYEAASAALKGFLSRHGDASTRLYVSARQMLAELANREAGRLGDVVDLMDFSRRRLKNVDGGEIVQTRQQTIIDLLDKLIQEAQEREKQASSSCSGGQSGNSTPQGGNPSNPMQQSQLPGGDPGGDPSRAARRANPGEMWGSMPPAERERVLQALRESFPGRYRSLVEQYYEELAKKP